MWINSFKKDKFTGIDVTFAISRHVSLRCTFSNNSADFVTETVKFNTLMMNFDRISIDSTRKVVHQYDPLSLWRKQSQRSKSWKQNGRSPYRFTNWHTVSAKSVSNETPFFISMLFTSGTATITAILRISSHTRPAILLEPKPDLRILQSKTARFPTLRHTLAIIGHRIPVVFVSLQNISE